MPYPPPKPQLRAAEPRHGPSFDTWNSSSTGHQRADNRAGGSTGWRDARSAKLHHQFVGARSGDRSGSQARVGDAPAAAPRLSILDMLARPGTMRTGLSKAEAPGEEGPMPRRAAVATAAEEEDDEEEEQKASVPRRAGGKVFEGLVIYVNGSTQPLISDHKLRQVLAANGARMSIHLARRQVTHVILGRPAGAGVGAGGGLAGGKLQREIQKVRGCGIKFVGVEWVLESVQAGKRLSEARFCTLKMATKAQGSVYGVCTKAKADAKSGTTSSTTPDNEPPPSSQRV